MTHIVAATYTKKHFKERMATDASRMWLDDPAIVGAVSGTAEDILMHKSSFTVTNHPKRSWFAHVYRNNKGKIVVE